jgi:hypothetical protein
LAGLSWDDDAEWNYVFGLVFEDVLEMKNADYQPLMLTPSLPAAGNVMFYLACHLCTGAANAPAASLGGEEAFGRVLGYGGDARGASSAMNADLYRRFEGVTVGSVCIPRGATTSSNLHGGDVRRALWLGQRPHVRRLGGARGRGPERHDAQLHAPHAALRLRGLRGSGRPPAP